MIPQAALRGIDRCKADSHSCASHTTFWNSTASAMNEALGRKLL